MASLMSKKNLSEEDIKRLYITPALEAKWQLITMETQVTDGQYNLKGNFASRKQGKRADYLLYISENNPIAVVEAKDNRHSISHHFISIYKIVVLKNKIIRKSLNPCTFSNR